MPFSSLPARLRTEGRLRKRVVAVPVVSVACLSLLSACGESDDTASDSSGGNSSSTATDTRPDGGPGGDGGIGGEADCSAAGTPTEPESGAVPENDDSADVTAISQAAQAFLATLDADQKKSVSYDYTDLETKECSWSNFPDGIFSTRGGLRMGDLTDDQVAAAKAVVQAAMSEAGYTYVTQELEGDNQLAGSDVGGASFGEDNYHIAFYGDPSDSSSWSLQFGGHHLAIMVSVGGDTLSVSPYFKGAQPVSYEYEGETVEPMGELADDFFGIFTSMDDDAESAAELDGEYTDLVMGPQSDADYPDTEGTAYGDLTSEEQQEVKDVIEGYVADYAGSLADPLIKLYESQLDDTYVAWATGLDQDDNAYLRIDGPRLWIEWVNTDNPGESGIHYHTIYRDKQLDYGTGTSTS